MPDRVLNYYEPVCDFPLYEGRPKIIYMVASVPRSGSTFFCQKLQETGVLGAPLEYFNSSTNRKIYARLGWGNSHRYWNSLLKLRTTPNGVFGYKMFVQNIRDIIRIRPDFLQDITPTHLVYFTREDKIAQAVSYARAIQTGQWFSDAPRHQRPKYDRDSISRALDSIISQEAHWERILELMDARPLRVTYEIFQADNSASVKTILENLEIEEEKSATNVFINKKQADEASLEWVDMYISGH